MIESGLTRSEKPPVGPLVELMNFFLTNWLRTLPRKCSGILRREAMSLALTD